MNASDKFEALIECGEIQFRPAEPGELCEWGRSLIKTFLTSHKIGWQLGDVKVGNSYCLKLEDSFLQYLDIMPDTMQFMWCTDDHHDSVHPDVASAYLAVKQFPGAKTRVWQDDTTGLRVMEFEFPDGRKVRVDDIMVDGERIIKFRRV